MDFTQIVAEIVATTKRADKLSVARREVNAAVSMLAQDGDWNRTFTESLVAINPAEYTQAIAMTEFARHRKFSYIRRAGTQQYLTKLDMAALAMSTCDVRDKYYIAGSNLNISMIAVAANLDVGWYAYPPLLTDASPDYWLLEGAWSAVLYHAMAKVFIDIGDPTSGQKFLSEGRAAWAVYRQNKHFQE